MWVTRLTATATRTARGCRQCRRGYAQANDGWEVVIGLEIHAQLKAKTKLFSRAPLSYGDAVNTNIELHDVAMPGSLPVLNLEAIRLSVMTALALKCMINPRSTFDRKHYFYHDIPASYQITQHYNPLARKGSLPIVKGEYGVDRDLLVGIQQLQVEQDTAKSQIVGEERLIDLNRAGTGLMEIVTDPDMRSPEEAGAFVRKLQSLLRRLGSGDGDMEKGNLRVDANVSVHRPGTPFGTRCEIKNLNSVKFLQQAIEFERKRHIAHYQSTSEPLMQETRTMNELTGATMPMRTKEDAEDYRYMPDANLPALVIKPGYLDRVRKDLPELPWETVNRISETYGVIQRDVETLLGLDEFDATGIRYFEEVVQGDAALGKRTSNLIVHELLGQLHKLSIPFSPRIIPSTLLREIVLSLSKSTITGTNVKAIFKFLIDNASSRSLHLEDILEELGIGRADSFDLDKVCAEAIAALPELSEDVRKGQVKAVGRIIGEVMRRSQGAADAKKAREVVLGMLGVKG